jgi:hypothetical protein
VPSAENLALLARRPWRAGIFPGRANKKPPTPPPCWVPRRVIASRVHLARFEKAVTGCVVSSRGVTAQLPTLVRYTRSISDGIRDYRSGYLAR